MTENKATQERTPQERLQEEQEHKEHVHHTKINAAAIADHLLGNMHTLHVKLHQYHWYVKGANFFTLHEKFEELYNENEKWFDKLAERLITSGHKPASTTVEFEKYSILSEDAVNKYFKAEDMVENIIEDFRPGQPSQDPWSAGSPEWSGDWWTARRSPAGQAPAA